MPIQGLIDKRDTSEIIADEIAAILALEVSSQMALAVAADRDPEPWRMRIFADRSNPWSEYLDAPDVASADASPIVNVSYDSSAFDMSQGNVVERQRGDFTYHVDCYGYGVARDVPDGGHVPGDLDAALAAKRAVRLVRNILMASQYTYLGLRGTVARRWIQSINMFQPALDGQTVQQIVGARITLNVTANEFAPQYEGEPLELVSVRVLRGPDGLVTYTEMDFDTTTPSDS